MAHPRRRHSARRPRRLALSAFGVLALVSAGLIVGFAGTGGTYAAWSSSVNVPGASISTGSTAVAVGTTASGSFGSRAELGALTGHLGPGATAVAPFAVKNTGTTPVALGASVAPGGSSALESALRVAVVAVGGGAQCTSALSAKAVSPLATYTAAGLPQLASGAVQNLCLVLTIPAGDASSAEGQSAPFTVNVTGTQAAA
jgi:predicted ribosomally synthesized peptide with SipW-like signal peptide